MVNSNWQMYICTHWLTTWGTVGQNHCSKCWGEAHAVSSSLESFQNAQRSSRRTEGYSLQVHHTSYCTAQMPAQYRQPRLPSELARSESTRQGAVRCWGRLQQVDSLSHQLLKSTEKNKFHAIDTLISWTTDHINIYALCNNTTWPVHCVSDETTPGSSKMKQSTSLAESLPRFSNTIDNSLCRS